METGTSNPDRYPDLEGGTDKDEYPIKTGTEQAQDGPVGAAPYNLVSFHSLLIALYVIRYVAVR